jgi:hypothetical protein
MINAKNGLPGFKTGIYRTDNLYIKDMIVNSKMPYQCIFLSAREYSLTLSRVLEHPTKSRKYKNFSEKYKSVTKAIKALETSDPDKHLLAIIQTLKDEMKATQEGMAKLIDSEYRAMQRENKTKARR